MRRALRLTAAAVVGLVAYLAITQRALFDHPWTVAMRTKAVGGDSPCTWRQLLSAPAALLRFSDLQENAGRSIRFLQEDKELGIQQYATSTRNFWIPASGQFLNGQKLLAYVLAEQDWLAGRAPEHTVRSGDVVMDVGAHVGTFADDALRRGAAKVIMIEPDPINQECIRRNYAAEIASGSVVLVPEGAWSSESTLEFHKGVGNSGSGSMVVAEVGSKTIQVPVRPIDQMVSRLGLAKLDFIKMDIEGAEREALKGALSTLRQFRPRIMLDAYHLPDDSTVLPALILSGKADYRSFCAACGPGRHSDDKRYVPYALFFY